MKKQSKAAVQVKFGMNPAPQQGFTCVALKDLKFPLPYKQQSLDAVSVEHLIEYLDGNTRIKFFNELWRVMKKGAQANVISRAWSHAEAYADWRVQWPPISEQWPMLMRKEMREAAVPDHPLTCDFDWTMGVGWDERLNLRNQEYKMDAMTANTNSLRFIIVNLTRK